VFPYNILNCLLEDLVLLLCTKESRVLLSMEAVLILKLSTPMRHLRTAWVKKAIWKGSMLGEYTLLGCWTEEFFYRWMFGVTYLEHVSA
jgi:hypothetical protein